ncbi:MAG: type II secretion system F family protein, partial [Nanoarchaeota archaeon]|nr:type II secretion system F family protein [Nanoarchaeota archaeon]
PLDLSLWKANRPRFGILSDEINQIARSTYASGSLIEPLNEFSKKYDSSLLRRIVSNLIEGIKTGADIASLLDDISMNIIMIRYTKKELASEVENYMLFITMTVLIISPFMFGLTYKMTGLIETVKNTLVGTFDASDDAVSKIPGGSIVPVGESTEDFRYYFDWFVHLMLATNVIVSVLLMSMVKHGNVKQDLKKIPVFYVICISVYALSKLLFSNFLVI